MHYFVINTVVADGLTPLGGRPSAGTVMTNVGFLIDPGPAREELEHTNCKNTSLLGVLVQDMLSVFYGNKSSGLGSNINAPVIYILLLETTTIFVSVDVQS